jgi:hypothetical protein
MTDSRESLADAFTDAALRRLSNQITRAHRGTFGAQAGLRTIAKALAGRMLELGSTPDDVTAAFVQVIRNHPAHDARQSEILIALAGECVAQAALETGRA